MASVRNEYQKGPALGFHSWPCAAAKQRDEKVCLLTERRARLDCPCSVTAYLEHRPELRLCCVEPEILRQLRDQA